MSPASLDGAYDACLSLARSHYENFPVASRWAPRDLRGPIAAVYAFARAADDFADEGDASPADRLKALADWRARLRAAGEGRHESHPIFLALSDTLQRFNLPLDPFDRLITAFERDVTVLRHPTFGHLLDYCHHSADPVGELVLRLHRAWTPERGAWSDAICTALQLANFWQDVTVDARKNRIYSPLEDLKTMGLSETDYLQGPFTDTHRELMAHQVDRTWGLFRRGRPLCDDVPALRRELRLVWLGGTRILEKIEGQDWNVWRRRPSLSKGDWAKLLFRWLFWSRP